MKTLIKILMCLLLPNIAFSDDIVRLGPNLNDNTPGSFFGYAYRGSLYNDVIIHQLEGSIWFLSNKVSVNAFYKIGPQLKLDNGLYSDILIGAGGVSLTDHKLSSHFEFSEEIEVGYKRVGIGFMHVSNAGLSNPNSGRDFLLLNFKF